MKKGDLIIIFVVILLIAFLGVAYLIYSNSISDNKVVNIYINNQLYKSVPLNKNTNVRIKIDNEYGYNIIHIYDNGVEVEEADCPNQNDVKQGFIKSPGIPIVCLPHKLVIIIEGSTETDFDYISYSGG